MFYSNSCRRRFLVCVVLVAAGCVNTLPPSYADEKGRAPTKALTPQVTTIELKLDKGTLADVEKAFGSDPPESLPLVMRGVTTPKGWDDGTTIRVFVNKPDAKLDTPPKGLHYARSFSLSPLDPERPKNHQIDLAPALNRLKAEGEWKPGMAIRVTFVLVPDDDRLLPADLKVTYTELVLTVPKTR